LAQGAELARLPAGVLLLGHRYDGTGRGISQLLALCPATSVEFLFRVPVKLKRRVVNTFSDGSALVLVEAADLMSAGQLRELSDRLMERVARPLSGWRRAELSTGGAASGPFVAAQTKVEPLLRSVPIRRHKNHPTNSFKALLLERPERSLGFNSGLSPQTAQ